MKSIFNKFIDATNKDSLNEFSNPANFTEQIDLGKINVELALSALRLMIRIRLAEEAVGELVKNGTVKCPCHLGIGQEAIAVGVSLALNNSDKVFGAHRSHSHFLALGGSANELIAEILGKKTGCSRGMGGSMHLYDDRVGFMGSVPIVAATIPIAVGCSLALKMKGDKSISVCYFGDGATEEGVFHESLNLAASSKLPTLFVCENNLYASHLDIKLRQPSDICSRFAVAHRIKSLVVDGNDVFAVKEATEILTKEMRESSCPGFLEAVTYRWRGHVGADENIDVGIRRSLEDLDAWKKRDPIQRLTLSLLDIDSSMTETIEKVIEEERFTIKEAVHFAQNSPYPPLSQLLDTVYTLPKDQR